MKRAAQSHEKARGRIGARNEDKKAYPLRLAFSLDDKMMTLIEAKMEREGVSKAEATRRLVEIGLENDLVVMIG